MKLESVTEVYLQDEDCCGRANETCQDIELSTHDGGGGSYIVIKTERWAVDDGKEIDAFAKMLKALLKRVNG